ncbi:hypothetical protein GTO10_01730 [Candidatus Saccharibacteria bacterium]|nr:hypothetical protein [Candidatus Saccharibacteria bacterium]
MFFSFSPPVASGVQELSLGFSFSPRYAEELGLDPQSSYLELLDTFDFTSVRIPVYWNRVYRDGIYDFSEVDFLIREAKRRGLSVVLSFGYRNFRWPECYAPEEFKEGSYADFERELLIFVGKVTDQFAGGSEVDVWQLENEPFLHPRCRFLKLSTIRKEIEQIRYSDDLKRPILLTFGGGEVLGFPLLWPLYKEADIIGASYYTRILDPLFRRFYMDVYALGILSPRAIWREREFIEGKDRDFWVIEVQAEPWAGDPRTMSPEILKNNWDLLLSQGAADGAYLWGVEWWLREKAGGKPQLFETARELFGTR